MSKPPPKSIAEYIQAAPVEARDHLRTLYSILKKAVPDAREAIKWRLPIFEMERILFAFGAYKTHLNFMPTPVVLEAFKQDLTDYQTGKGSLQLPYDRPIPKALIRRMALMRLKQLKESDAKWM